MAAKIIIKEDTYKHKGMRAAMCDELRKKNITDERVLAAMNMVVRHQFMGQLDNLAYEDLALPIHCGQTISQPSTVAQQSQLLNIEPGMKVLEIGTGSGYQTAVLCAMKAKVFTIERQKELFEQTRTLLQTLHYTAKCFLGDGYQGLTEVDYGPYDRALITCGAPYIPEGVMRQLKIGGIMVIPVGDQQQEMLRIVKNGEDKVDWIVERFGKCRFVPMLEGRQF